MCKSRRQPRALRAMESSGERRGQRGECTQRRTRLLVQLLEHERRVLDDALLPLALSLRKSGAKGWAPA
eukprot:6206660-Pleurochrysis_carterae.AAC.1